VASEGRGDSLGRALVNALAAAAGGTVGVRKSYNAVGWHAQISKLTSSPRGYEAAAAAGLSATARTLKAWLAQDVEPNAANRAKIAEAYAIMAGRWPDGIERQDVNIHGQVRTGNDSRERGGGSASAPLLIDGRVGDWRRIKDAWNSGRVDADDFEDWFIEDVIEADIGEGSDEWEFPGGSYMVVIG
jgi:hypothetical protein